MSPERGIGPSTSRRRGRWAPCGAGLHGGGRMGGRMSSRQAPDGAGLAPIDDDVVDAPPDAVSRLSVRRQRGRTAAVSILGALALVTAGLAATRLAAADRAE